MNSKTAQNLLLVIDNEISSIKQLTTSGVDPQIQAYLAQYLAVKICGIYEECIETILIERVERSKDEVYKNVVSHYLRNYFRNPDRGKILGLMTIFDSNWRTQLDQLDTAHIAALDNIVSAKNDVAHGKMTSITLRDIFKDYTESRIVLEKIDEVVLAQTSLIPLWIPWRT